MLIGPAAQAESLCYGSTSAGRVADACKLPADGDNFSSYSTLARWLGRTFVHCKVSAVIEAAYAALAEAEPEKTYVYGETGLRTGGPFKPHKTHQNGLSVDFMVPVVDADGMSVPLPTSALNKYGYDLEFDAQGALDELRIDFEAIAAHLAAIVAAAEQQGIGIWRVIFDPALQPRLRETDAWSKIAHLEYSTRRSWVRHDDHYHVDFAIPCEPLSAWQD